jgi:hypothetical protein
MRRAELMCDEKTRNDGNEDPHGEWTYEDVDAVMNEVTLWWNFSNSTTSSYRLSGEMFSRPWDNFSDVEHASQDEALELYLLNPHPRRLVPSIPRCLKLSQNSRRSVYSLLSSPSRTFADNPPVHGEAGLLPDQRQPQGHRCPPRLRCESLLSHYSPRRLAPSWALPSCMRTMLCPSSRAVHTYSLVSLAVHELKSPRGEGFIPYAVRDSWFSSPRS